MRVFALLLIATFSRGQSPGVVVYQPATGTTVATITATAAPGSTACTITGNSNLAGALVINCKLYANPTLNDLPSYTVPLAPRQSYVFQYRSDADSITAIAQADASGYITVMATVNGSTPVGGAF